MVPDQENDHQKKKKTKLTLLDSLMSLGLNLLGLDPLVKGFESDHRHRDKILKIIHQSHSERFFLGVCFRTPSNKTSFFENFNVANAYPTNANQKVCHKLQNNMNKKGYRK
jgi:hypothetical protein